MEREPRRLLQGEIAGRKGVGVPDAKQEIKVGRPRPDALVGDERRVRGVRRQLRQRLEVEMSVTQRAGERAEGLDLRPRQAGALELRRARAQDLVMVERSERLLQPPPNRARARGGKLLAADDRGKTGEAASTPSQR